MNAAENHATIARAADLFAGTVPYYLRYRPRYPDALIADVMARCRLSRGGRVLDLGCGPGFLTVPLAVLGAEVVAVDPQPEMLAAGQVEAEAAGWDAAQTPLAGATLGRSFHWMQREAVLDFLDRVMAPGGRVVLVNEERGDNIPWRRVLREHVQDWHGGTGPTQGFNTRRSSGRRHEEVLAESPFNRLERRVYPVARHWSIDSIVGYAYSTSSANPHLLGDGIDAFEAGLRERLAALPGAPDFTEEADVVAILAQRTAS